MDLCHPLFVGKFIINKFYQRGREWLLRFSILFWADEHEVGNGSGYETVGERYSRETRHDYIVATATRWDQIN